MLGHDSSVNGYRVQHVLCDLCHQYMYSLHCLRCLLQQGAARFSEQIAIYTEAHIMLVNS